MVSESQCVTSGSRCVTSESRCETSESRCVTSENGWERRERWERQGTSGNGW